MTDWTRSLCAPLAGYLTLVCGALVFQDALFGSVTHASTSTAIVIGGGLTALGCVVAGYVVAWIAPSRPALHMTPLVAWLCIETALLHLKAGSPLWFDVMAGGSNALGVMLGVWLWIRAHERSLNEAHRERGKRNGPWIVFCEPRRQRPAGVP